VLFFSCGPNWSFLGKNDLQSCETPHWRFVTCHSDKSISSLKSNAHLYDFQCLWFHGRDNIGNIIFLPSHIPLSCKWYPHFTIVHTCMHLQIKTYVPCITKCNIWLLCHLHGKAKKAYIRKHCFLHTISNLHNYYMPLSINRWDLCHWRHITEHIKQYMEWYMCKC
jgi:hypothetical protein